MLAAIALTAFVVGQSPAIVVDPRASEHLLYGIPGLNTPGTTLILREGYAALHDEQKKAPLWVAYRYKPEFAVRLVPRASSSAFRPEPLLPPGARAELADYRNSGWDRGHMAPADHMRRSPQVQRDSFLLSNMVPQNSSNNGGIWRSIEQLSGGYGEEHDIVVICGPIYGKPMADGTVQVLLTRGAEGIRVPSWLFKIVVRTVPGRPDPEVLAFKLENKPLPASHPRQFLVSVRDIEADTGLNFLNALPIAMQNRIETGAAPDVW
jgi:endonuclease G, mitochondrial